MIIFRKTIGVIKNLTFDEKNKIVKSLPYKIGYKDVLTRSASLSTNEKYKLILYRKRNNDIF